MRPNNTEKIPESHYRDLSGDSSGNIPPEDKPLKGGDINNSTIANNPQNANDQIACKFLRRQTIGRDTLYEGNVRSQEKSRPGETGRYNTATIADFNGNISLKNISPRREGEIKNLSQQREEISKASDGGANVVPSSTNSDSYVGGAPVSAGRSPDVTNITQEVQNVNDRNDHATTRKAPVSPGELIEPGYNGEVSLKSAYKKPLANSLADVERNVVSGESAQITPNEDARLAPNNRSIEVADRQLADNFTGATTDYSVANNSRNVNEDVKYKLNPEHEAQVIAYNEHITRLRQREEYLRGLKRSSHD